MRQSYDPRNYKTKTMETYLTEIELQKEKEREKEEKLKELKSRVDTYSEYVKEIVPVNVSKRLIKER